VKTPGPARKARALAGPFKIPVDRLKDGSPERPATRDELLGRARRHCRAVAAGPRPTVDPDESVRRSPPGPRPAPGRPHSRLTHFLGDDDDLD
jgi:hypothetical protein